MAAKLKKLKRDGTESRQGEGGGRPPAFATEQELKDRLIAYAAECDAKKQMPNKAGLCLFLSIDRSTYNDYKKKFPHALNGIERLIENAWVQRLGGPNATGSIFYLKNAFKEDYKDRHETDVTSKGEQIHVYIPTRK